MKMGARLAGLILVLCAVGGAAFAGPQQAWPPISDAEKAVTQCPGEPGAPAVYLYREMISNQDDWTFYAFNRLKILTPAGKEYGTVEIPYSDAWQVENIKARVRQPDGRLVNFTGEIFEKTVVEVGQIRHLVKTFALPDLDVGSTIEYSYSLKLDLKKAAKARSLSLERWEPEEGGEPPVLSQLSFMVDRWDLKAPLYTFKAKLTHIPLRGGQISFDGISLRLAWVSFGLNWGPPAMENGRVVLEVTDIPALSKEEFAPPADDSRMGVIFFLCSAKVLKAEDYWQLEGANWQTAVEKFLKGKDGLAAESWAVISGAGTQLEKLAAIYARAQSIKNLSYDRELSPERRRELKIKDNRNVGEVLKRNQGLRSDITRTFVALARAAGFTADVARVATRDDKPFHKNILDFYGLLDTELAIVDVDGCEIFCDPATPGCPLGLVPWTATDTTYIRSFGDPGAFSTIPLDPPETSQTSRAFDLALGADGRLSGSGTMTCTGQEALALRLEYLWTDEAEARKSLGEKMSALLPAGGTASVRKVENLTGSKDELRIEFDVALPAATAAGERLLLPVMPYRTGWRDAFRHADRTSSVHFPYLVRESDDITISVPADLKVETVPEAVQSAQSFAEYSLATSIEGGSKVRIRRLLAITKNVTSASLYAPLKSLFDKARAGDDGQIVLSVDKK